MAFIIHQPTPFKTIRSLAPLVGDEAELKLVILRPVDPTQSLTDVSIKNDRTFKRPTGSGRNGDQDV